MTKAASADGAAMVLQIQVRRKPKNRRKFFCVKEYRIFSQAILHAQKKQPKLQQKKLCLPVTLLPQFREVNNGVLAGMPKSEAAEKYPGLYFASLDFDESYPNGESPATFYKRIRLAWANFKAVASENKMTPLLVTHGGVINVILCIENGAEYTNKIMTYKTPYAGIVEI